VPEKVVLVCSKCKTIIEEDPMLGDKQGGRVQIVMGADTWELVLGTKHKQPLYDLYGDYVEKYLPGGTATGAETIRYLPRVADDEAAVEPPRFSQP